MAGLFDDFTQNTAADPEAVRRALLAEQAQQFQQFSSKATTREDRIGRDIFGGLLGLAQSGAFGEKAQSFLEQGVDDDPRLKEVRDNAALAAEIRSLEGDPTSAIFAQKAADLAQARGRDDLALQYRSAAGTRQKQELAVQAEAQAAAVTQARQQFSALPTSAQEELIAVRPEFLTETLSLDPLEAANISKNMEERNVFQREKLKKQMLQVKAATNTKTTNADVNQTKATLSSITGLDADSFGGEEEFDTFVTPLAAEVQRRMDVLKDEGKRGDRNDITAQVFDEMQQQGVLSVVPSFFEFAGYGPKVEDVDPQKLKEFFAPVIQSDVIDLSN